MEAGVSEVVLKEAADEEVSGAIDEETIFEELSVSDALVGDVDAEDTPVPSGAF